MDQKLRIVAVCRVGEQSIVDPRRSKVSEPSSHAGRSSSWRAAGRLSQGGRVGREHPRQIYRYEVPDRETLARLADEYRHVFTWIRLHAIGLR